MKYIEEYIKNLNEMKLLSQDLRNLLEDMKNKNELINNINLMTAFLLLDKTLLTIKSMLKILPYSSYDKSEQKDWDISSVAALVRNIIENYNMFFYLVVENVEEEEKDLRRDLCELHSFVEKLKMYESLGIDKETMDLQEKNIETIKNRIMKNTLFKKFSYEKRKNILKGDRVFYFSKWLLFEKIDIGLNPKEIEFMYRFTSNYIHTSPFAIEDIISDQETEIVYISDLISAINKYLKK